MKKHVLRSFILGILFTMGALSSTLAQSKTEKVEDKLNNSTDDDYSDSDNGGGWDWVFEFFFQNIPYLLYFETYDPIEYYAFYNPYPFYPNSYNNTGLRSYDSNKRYSLQLDLDHSYFLFRQVDQNLALSGKWRIDYWAFDVAYRQWNEQNSPVKMHQFHAALERKMRYLPKSEASVQIGYQSFGIRKKQYNGMYFGFESDYYWLNPISFQFNYSGMLVDKKGSEYLLPASGMQTGIRYHYKQAAFGVFYERLNMDGIIFQSVNLGYSIYF